MESKTTLKIVGYTVVALISISIITTLVINYKTNKELKELEAEKTK